MRIAITRSRAMTVETFVVIVPPVEAQVYARWCDSLPDRPSRRGASALRARQVTASAEVREVVEVGNATSRDLHGSRGGNPAAAESRVRPGNDRRRRP